MIYLNNLLVISPITNRRYILNHTKKKAHNLKLKGIQGN